MARMGFGFGINTGGAQAFVNNLGGMSADFKGMAPGLSLPSYFSVTRASTDYAWNGTQFAQVASGAPSFWYGKGLAVFGAATNLALWSSDFSQATWTYSGTKAAAISIFASGGVAQKCTSSAINQPLAQTIGTFTGSSETLYFIHESGTDTSGKIEIYNNTTPASVALVTVTYSTDAIALTSGSGTAGGFKITDSGPNGGKVYLVAITFTSTAGNARIVRQYVPGNGTYFYAHHAQLVTGTRIRPPIVTNAAPTSRAADVISIAIANLPWLSASPAQLYLGAQIELLQAADNTQWGVSINDGSTANRIALFSQSSSQSTSFQVRTAGASVDNVFTGTYTQISKSAYSVSAASTTRAAQGVAVGTSSALAMPTGFTKLDIGHNLGIEQLQGFIGSIYAGPTTQAQAWLNARTA